MNSDEDTRRETSPEKVNEYTAERTPVLFSGLDGGHWPQDCEQSSGLGGVAIVPILYRFFIGRFFAITRNVYMREEKKRGREREGKSALSIGWLINSDWIGRILSGVMMTGIVPALRISQFNLQHYGPVICLCIASKLLRVQRSATLE